MLSEYCCVCCGRISMIQEGVLSSRVGRFDCNERFRKIRFQNQDWSVLRYFEIPLPETELRKGRELLAKRGEQKIRKNQVQAICHSLVDTSRIVGHQPTANTSIITRNFLIQIPVIQTQHVT